MAQMKDVSLFAEAFKKERAQTKAEIGAAFDEIYRETMRMRGWYDNLRTELVLLRLQVDSLQGYCESKSGIVQHEKQTEASIRRDQEAEEARPGAVAEDERREGEPLAETTASQERQQRDDR